MIIYDENQKAGLAEFGIKIPICDSKSTRSFETLCAHEILGKRRDEWHLRRSAEKVSEADLLRVHSAEYVDRLFSEKLEKEIIRTFELIDAQGQYYRYNPQEATQPLSHLFDRLLEKAGGTVQCCRVALEKGFCFYFGGGMHHAQAGFGNGFCMINDIVIAIRKLRAEKRIRTAWVIDMDAHKGDGTAALTKGDASITTLSIHMAKGWPLDGPEYDADGQPNPSFISSDIDIPIGPGAEDQYVPGLEAGLKQLAEKPGPDLAVVVSGVDPYEHDELPSAAELKLSLAQLRERDLLVYNFLKARKIPGAWLMAGGYGERSWEAYAQFLEYALSDRLNSA